MWPRSADELVLAQRALAAAAPPLWRPGERPAVGACVVTFPRGRTGPGAAGDPAWAAATVVRGRRVLADAVVRGEAGGPYVPGLLAWCVSGSFRLG